MEAPNRMLTVHQGPQAVPRDARDERKGAIWTDWIPTWFYPSRLSSLSRSAILRGVPHVRTIESFACQHSYSVSF